MNASFGWACVAGGAWIGVMAGVTWAQPGGTPNPKGDAKPPAQKIELTGTMSLKRDDSASQKLGWTLGVQAWTFRDRTAVEAIQTARFLGLKAIELYSGQKLSPTTGDAKVGPDLSDEHKALLKKTAADAGVSLNSYGVIGISTDEAEARKNFEFARGMGMKTIACEPTKDAWDLASKLSDEYKLALAIHDHPKPSFYWNPDTVLEATKGRSSRMGACADTGHWPRSGLNPIECLKKLEGHIIELHFKDIVKDDKHPQGEDQPWGTGGQDARGMLKELKRQGFKGVILIEYETGSGAELEANVAKCVKFFDEAAKEMADTQK